MSSVNLIHISFMSYKDGLLFFMHSLFVIYDYPFDTRLNGEGCKLHLTCLTNHLPSEFMLSIGCKHTSKHFGANTKYAVTT